MAQASDKELMDLGIIPGSIQENQNTSGVFQGQPQLPNLLENFEFELPEYISIPDDMGFSDELKKLIRRDDANYDYDSRERAKTIRKHLYIFYITDQPNVRPRKRRAKVAIPNMVEEVMNEDKKQREKERQEYLGQLYPEKFELEQPIMKPRNILAKERFKNKRNEMKFGNLGMKTIDALPEVAEPPRIIYGERQVLPSEDEAIRVLQGGHATHEEINKALEKLDQCCTILKRGGSVKSKKFIR
jgi:hypothetical protein